jgi:hypothetical protein
MSTRNAKAPTVAQVVSQAPDLANIVAGVRKQRPLQSAVDAVFAPTNGLARITDIDGPTATLIVDSSAAATRVKQLQVKLVRSLAEQRPEVTKLKVKIQVATVTQSRKRADRTPMPAAFLAKIAEDMQDSPLKSALQEIGKQS